LVVTLSFPQHPTPFVGREGELTEIARLLADPACRLLTLVGPGGIGKTRLALEVARIQQHTFEDGIHFVALQPLTSSDFIMTAVAEAIGFQFYPGGELKQQLLNYLREKSMLLIMDNLEHLLDGVHLLTDVLATAPGVCVLATSRERLNLREEWVLDVDGLSCPASEGEREIEGYSAVELFLQHARRVKVSFTLTDTHKAAVIRLCRVVGGMPLALELASPWVRVLSIDDIAGEIERCLDILASPARNVEPRHRNMRATFEPTWSRLSGDEQTIFKKLSVFRGGFTREAAEYMTGASLSLLSGLVDKSLVRVDRNGRYDIHELLRQYGAERLNASANEAEQTHDFHCHYYSTFLEQCWPRLTGSEIKQALTELDIELDNVRAAWAWAVRKEMTARIEASLDSLWFFYDERARYREGEQAFATAAEAFGENSPDSIGMRAKIQVRQGALCHPAGLFDKGNSLLRDSVMILRHSEARADLALALKRLALLLSDNNLAPSEVAEYLQESLTIYTELDHRWDMAHVLSWLSIFHHREFARRGVQGALERAEQCAWECMSLYQQLDSTSGIAAAYLNLADVAHQRGEYEKCKNYAQKSLSLFREIGTLWGISISLILMGESACKHGAYAEAWQCTVQGLQVPFEYRLASINFFTLHHLALAAQIWLTQGEMAKAFEVIGLLDQQRQKYALSQGQHSAFAALTRLENDLSPDLTAAVERGRASDADTIIKEIIADFSRTVESDAALLALTAAQSLPDLLTERELEVLRLVADGFSNRDIAEQLVLTVSTVKWHLNEIYSKLHVSSRTQAIRRAQELNLLS
jgi:predicted ATPase/DNA-binding NarL/FixJ family response regulator